ncbi:G/U mismatch-specific DNA glycosylase [Cesiribacter sp. SM1]|uniref:G/U mismatch-specific DNA glycosylase n=1 Tax=Cesiribacter sp. SM1 TaxID=2861196 RepID=UPI001CD4E934|nr:G/U mismatch-specific DNA glycosylase [Cesiribacter sp. SM1]
MASNKIHKPTPEALKAAENTLLPDLIAPNLKVLFCGINPSLYSAATGYHFARPGNRFWPALYGAGFTSQVLKPQEQYRLLECGYGITNVADRPTTAAAELSKAEIAAGALQLQQKVKQYRPKVLAILGLTVYKAAFNITDARVGLQEEPIENTHLWVLPNPSGLNAHYTPVKLKELFQDLRLFAEALNKF